MPDYITTSSGTHFMPTKPDAAAIHITDIAHALSLICRGNGHVKQFFSVGQHCIHCALEARARGCSVRVCLACLPHDASEAYMSDVPSPFKKYLKDYNMWEENLLNIIYEKYLGAPLTTEEEALVRRIDKDMLYFDLRILLNEITPGGAPAMKSVFSYDVLPFEEVERRYLRLFEEYAAILTGL